MKRPIFLYSFLTGLIWILYSTLFISRGGFFNYFSFSIFLFFICLFLGMTHFIGTSSNEIFSKTLGIFWFFLAILSLLSIGGLLEHYIQFLEHRGAFFLPFYFSIIFLFTGGILFILIGVSFIKGKLFWLTTIEKKRGIIRIIGVFLIIIVIFSSIFQYPFLVNEIKSIQKMKEMMGENKGEDIENIMRFFEKFDKEMKKEGK